MRSEASNNLFCTKKYPWKWGVLSIVSACLFWLCIPLAEAQEGKSHPPVSKEESIKSELGVANPFFWEVRGEKGEVAHLMGTMHIPSDRWKRLPSTLLADLDQADAIYGELDLTDKTRMTGKLMERAMLSNGDTLEKLIGPEVYKDLDRYLQSRGQSALFMNGMHPKMAEMTLGLLDVMPLLMSGKPVLDDWLLQRAKAAGKEVGGVETMEEQIAALFSGTLEEAKISLGFTLKLLKQKESAGRKPLEDLQQAYFSGRESSVVKVIEEELRGAPEAQIKAMDLLLNQRNKVMVRRVHKLLKDHPKKRYVFAFGVAHFVGKDSVVEGLKSLGYIVKRRYAPSIME